MINYLDQLMSLQQVDMVIELAGMDRNGVGDGLYRCRLCQQADHFEPQGIGKDLDGFDIVNPAFRQEWCWVIHTP